MDSFFGWVAFPWVKAEHVNCSEFCGSLNGLRPLYCIVLPVEGLTQALVGWMHSPSLVMTSVTLLECFLPGLVPFPKWTPRQLCRVSLVREWQLDTRSVWATSSVWPPMHHWGEVLFCLTFHATSRKLIFSNFKDFSIDSQSNQVSFSQFQSASIDLCLFQSASFSLTESKMQELVDQRKWV